MIISLIAAVSKNRVIGKDNRLPWHLPDDMQYFMNTTIGHHVLMGRKSYDALPPKFRPLPHRTNIIVSRQKAPGEVPYFVVGSPEEGLRLAEQRLEEEVFVTGGAQIYGHVLPLTQRMYLTEIDARVEGDVYFPAFDRNEWLETSRKHHPADNRHAFSFDFVVYRRKK